MLLACLLAGQRQQRQQKVSKIFDLETDFGGVSFDFGLILRFAGTRRGSGRPRVAILVWDTSTGYGVLIFETTRVGSGRDRKYP